jgi:chemotaxis signal transduction protein
MQVNPGEAHPRKAQQSGRHQGRGQERDHILPIIDMRTMFQLGDSSYDQFTVVIVLHIDNHIISMVMDSISDMPPRTDQASA